MKALYLDCSMGIAGDMLCGALLDLLDDEQKNIAIEKINSFGVHGVTVSAKNSVKCGISGTKFDVEIEHEHHYHPHSSLSEIFDIIDSFDINDSVKDDAKKVYSLIAEAESKVHGKSVTDVHLHEVGAKDAIIDVTSACYLIDFIGIEKITSSPITTGFGSVKAAHGVLSVPAPATSELLVGIKALPGDVESELCTPTGAALIKHFATIESANYTAKKIGYGMGTKDFERPNCVKAVLYENDSEDVYELRCQVDDMTGEEMGYAINKLMDLGALDAFVTPIVMKKSRPALALTVITTPDKKDFFVKQIFKHTTTLGIRQVLCSRSKLDREITEKNSIKIKKSTGFGVEKEKVEFDDLAKLADDRDISLFEARKLI